MISRINNFYKSNINFIGRPSEKLIADIKKAGQKKIHDEEIEAKVYGRPVDENRNKASVEWTKNSIDAVTEYMEGFHDDIELTWSGRDWEFKDIKRNTSFPIQATGYDDKFSLENKNGRLGYLINNITPDFVQGILLEQLMQRAKILVQNSNKYIQKSGVIDRMINDIDTFARGTNQPNGYKEIFLPQITALREESVGPGTINLSEENFIHKTNQELVRIYYKSMKDAHHRHSRVPEIRDSIMYQAQNEMNSIGENASKSCKKLEEKELNGFVNKVGNCINNLENYANEFPGYVTIHRKRSGDETYWTFGIYKDKDISVPDVVRTTKPEQKISSAIEFISDDINKLISTAKHEDIENELLQSCMNIVLTSKLTDQEYKKLHFYIEDLAKRTEQEDVYRQFLNELEKAQTPNNELTNTILAQKKQEQKLYASNAAVTQNYIEQIANL